MGQRVRRVEVRLAYADLAAAVDAVTALLASSDAVVVELTGPGAADLRTVSALARLVLAARRSQAELSTRADDADLPRLAELAGLADVLRVQPASRAGRSADRGG